MGEIKLDPGDVFLLPTNAIYRINDKLDNASIESSVYSVESNYAIEDQAEDELYISDHEFAQRLSKFGLDVNGLPLRGDLIFATFDQAANFEYSTYPISFWQKLKGMKATPTEAQFSEIHELQIPHIALWDYFGGSTCLDLNCIAGDQINVLSEEYQVREVGAIVNDKESYFRLPMRWSLGRWINNRKNQPIVGLIPSSNKKLFNRPTWYIGIADLANAYEYLLEDRSSYRAGLFVIFSPIWLNIDPNEYRPFILLEMCCKSDHIMRQMTAAFKERIQNPIMLEELRSRIFTLKTSKNDDGQAALKSQLGTPSVSAIVEPKLPTDNAGAEVPEQRAEGGGDNPESESKLDNEVSSSQTKKSDQHSLQKDFKKGKGDEKKSERINVNQKLDDIEQEHFAEHAALPFYIKSYTIRRNRIGRYLLFNRQFATLYDLVYYLTTNQSPLPHKLSYGPAKRMKSAHFSFVPPPFENPKRDIYALTMKCEQWAARHYDQVTEPLLLSQAFSYSSRSIFDPFKKSHMEYAASLGLKDKDIKQSREYINQFMPVEQTVNDAPTDESVLKTDKSIEIDLTNLKFGSEDILGSGAFGAVYRGKLKTINNQEVDVAIKKLKMFAPTDDSRQPWISEMEILQIVNHPNTTRFYGFCYDESKEYVMLAFELMDMGSLADFMKAREYNVTANENVDFLTQIARGMSHLHSLDPPIMHGDLAARNVLMCHHPVDSTRYILKISDYGLSKTTRHEVHVFPDDPGKMPFKWLPPEVLHRRELSTKSDVWAYGILATEIYGVVDPYGMLPNEKLLSFLNDGHRMEKPTSMPHYIYEILLRCWRRQPIDRPTFDEIERDLKSFYIECELEHIQKLTTRIVSETAQNNDEEHQ